MMIFLTRKLIFQDVSLIIILLPCSFIFHSISQIDPIDNTMHWKIAGKKEKKHYALEDITCWVFLHTSRIIYSKVWHYVVLSFCQILCLTSF